MAQRMLFVMDPIERVHPEKDTTFAMIRAANRLGVETHVCDIKHLSVLDGNCSAHVQNVRIAGQPTAEIRGEEDRPIGDYTALFMRKDPPFDSAYLFATLQLEYARGKTNLVNDPRGLRDANEKLYAINFRQWMPTTLVTSDPERIYAFVEEVGGQAVIKPLDGAGGSGVLVLRKGDSNIRSIVDTLTGEGRRLAMVQQFLPAVTKGDKRILLLDGVPLGAINRVPRADDHRSNIHVGGRVEAVEVTSGERTMIEAMAPRLLADGLRFVGLDVIDGRLTEVNVTSPTGIQEMSRFAGRDLAEDVIRAVL
ncbi:MAG: glutathione synthase [Polyangiaceae bacterium]|nr:glutathione synthase [Polyangiaceae bacterium]